MGAKESDHNGLFPVAPEPTTPEGVPWDQFNEDGTWNAERTRMVEKLASKFAQRTVLERSGGYLEPTNAHLHTVLGAEALMLSADTLEAVRSAYNTIYPRKTRRKVTVAQHKANRK